jgi:hypothetical protein
VRGRRPMYRIFSMSALTILLIALAVVLVGSLPAWPYSRGWGFYPSGITGAALLVLLGLLLIGRIGTT